MYRERNHLLTMPCPLCKCLCLQIECCIRCLAQGVGAAHIIDGRAKHSILMELLTDEGVGTMITG
jgi:acetylglutamate kinase